MENQTTIQSFFDKLQKVCKEQYVNGSYKGCITCCFRDFCYTPPILLNQDLIQDTLDKLRDYLV